MSVSVFAAYRDSTFERITVEIEFLDRLVGGQPKDPKLVQGWLRKGMGVTDQEELFHRTRQHLLEMVESDEEALRLVEAATTMDDLVAVSERLAGELKTQGFKRGADGNPYIESRHIKAMIKESVNILFAGDKWGRVPAGNGVRAYDGKGPKAFTAERVFPGPGRIAVGTPEDISVDMAISHLTGPQGPRSTIGYYEYVERKTLSFEILQTLEQKTNGNGEAALDYDRWGKVFAHMELNGLGAMRSQGFGQFLVTRFEYVK